MRGEYRRTFVVQVPATRAWEAFASKEGLGWYASEIEAFEARPGGRLCYTVAGYGTVEGTVEEVKPGRFIRWTEGAGLLPGATEVAVALEEVGAGTRITVTQSGFGEGYDWATLLETHTLGWNQIIANLALYLLKGISYDRMFTWRVQLGLYTTDTLAGAEVVAVRPDSFGSRAAMRPGDLVLRLAGAPIFNRADLWLIEREHVPGEEAEVVYLRDGIVISIRAVL